MDFTSDKSSEMCITHSMYYVTKEEVYFGKTFPFPFKSRDGIDSSLTITSYTISLLQLHFYNRQTQIE